MQLLLNPNESVSPKQESGAIRDACTAARLPSLAAKYIKRRAPIENVRTELFEKVIRCEPDPATLEQDEALEEHFLKQAQGLRKVADFLNLDLVSSEPRMISEDLADMLEWHPAPAADVKMIQDEIKADMMMVLDPPSRLSTLIPKMKNALQNDQPLDGSERRWRDWLRLEMKERRWRKLSAKRIDDIDWERWAKAYESLNSLFKEDEISDKAIQVEGLMAMIDGFEPVTIQRSLTPYYYRNGTPLKINGKMYYVVTSIPGTTALRRQFYNLLNTAIGDGSFWRLIRCHRCNRFTVVSQPVHKFCRTPCKAAYYNELRRAKTQEEGRSNSAPTRAARSAADRTAAVKSFYVGVVNGHMLELVDLERFFGKQAVEDLKSITQRIRDGDGQSYNEFEMSLDHRLVRLIHQVTEKLWTQKRSRT